MLPAPMKPILLSFIWFSSPIVACQVPPGAISACGGCWQDPVSARSARPLSLQIPAPAILRIPRKEQYQAIATAARCRVSGIVERI